MLKYIYLVLNSKSSASSKAPYIALSTTSKENQIKIREINYDTLPIQCYVPNVVSIRVVFWWQMIPSFLLLFIAGVPLFTMSAISLASMQLNMLAFELQRIFNHLDADNNVNTKKFGEELSSVANIIVFTEPNLFNCDGTVYGFDDSGPLHWSVCLVCASISLTQSLYFTEWYQFPKLYKTVFLLFGQLRMTATFNLRGIASFGYETGMKALKIVVSYCMFLRAITQ
nr:unnamed protein product [Callosobruchus chinensis]